MNDFEASVRELIDRQRIWDCLLRYTRGVDRLDRELLMSAFHDDAVIDQGAFKGSAEQLSDWVLSGHRDNQLQTLHLMTNHLCELEGDTAHAETYVAYYGLNPGNEDSFAVGRYVDRLERRGNDWGIVCRVVTLEGTTDFKQNGFLDRMEVQEGSIASPARDHSDPSYMRPLKIKSG